MSINKLQILCLCSLLFAYNTMFAQNASFVYKRSGVAPESRNVIISNIQHIDTIYWISNPRISYRYMERHVFENQACFGFKTDSLYFPKHFSKRKFANNLLSPRSFYLLASTAFVNKVIIPEVTDTTLLQLLNQSYNGDWNCIIISEKEHKGKNYRYVASTYNTHCFLSVFIKTDIFNLEYNRIFNPPRYLYPKEASRRDVYVKFLFPLKKD